MLLRPQRGADCAYNRLAVSDEVSGVKVGDLIDNRYRITGSLGHGGMGQVFRAEHVGIKREVALKLLHRELRDDEATNERIMREAFATGRLDHPNCVTITDSGTHEDGDTYLVMELLKGQSLGDELDLRGTLPVVEALHITKHVLMGLAHAHSVGVVHRDLKPDNIFLVKQDEGDVVAKILDFGIAKLLGDAVQEEGGNDLTQAGMAIGSPTYMSPEQATGGELDGRSDLYSLSLVLYEMICGEPPFYEEDNKVLSLQRRLKEDPPVMRAPSGAKISTAVDLMVRAGLARDVEARTASAEDYLAQVNAELAALEGDDTDQTPTSVQRPKVETPAPPPTPASRSDKQRQLMMLGGAAGGLLLLVLVIVALSGKDSKKKPTSGEDEATLEMKPDYLEDKVTEDPNMMAKRFEEELSRLDKEVAAGRGPRHMKALQRLQSLWSQSSRTNRLLGLAFMQKRYWQDGFKYLRKAIALDSELRSDEEIIKAALRSLTSRSKPELGVRFLVRDIGETAVPLLEETVKGGSDRQQEYAKRALKQLGAAGG